MSPIDSKNAFGDLDKLSEKTSLSVMLESLPKWEASSFSPLEVPQALAAALGSPQDTFNSVHVAGTNGKGSVCAFIAASFAASGFSVGQFVSPHLTNVTERCLLGGKPVDENEFASAVTRVIETANELELTPSYFVVTMLATFLIFADRNIQWGVVEVGLGGRYDATSIIRQPKLSVITRIGHDHMHWLGDSLAEIAGNKAGIIKPGTPVIIGANEIEASKVCCDHALEMNVDCFSFNSDFHLDLTNSNVSFPNVLSKPIPLSLSAIEAKSFHAENRALAICAASLCGVKPEAIKKAASSVYWPGRTELLEVEQGSKKVSVLLDGLHNPQGARAFVEYLKVFLEALSYKKLVIVLSLRATKKADEIFACLNSVSDFFAGDIEYIITGEDIPLAQNPNELALQRPGSKVVPDSTKAVERALSVVDSDGLVLVLGSLYLIGTVRPKLTDKEFCAIC